ncbi:acetyl-CoA hydrolase/transferase family protein [Sphingoaurantiacus capsulatus]|uniref:Acetyl-CoA hydrolase/transferase family protein n=1 Tax=Sphingoaurantiacus capsulatus TaxID=1771310 RepID=A0ABV7XBD4_9SPHN
MIRFVPGDHRLAALLADASTVLVQGCTGASDLLAAEVMSAGDAIGAVGFTGIQLPGVNRASWLANPRCRFTTYFMTPELKAAGAQVVFLPINYSAILDRLRRTKIDAAIFQVSPPDATGLCSFGPTVDFLAELWPQVGVRIAQINPNLPRTAGPTGIPLREIHYAVEAATPIVEAPDPAPDPVSTAIAAHLAPFVGDGATLQAGLGKLPGTILRSLADRRRLRVHSGLIGDGVLDLLEAGAIEGGAHITAGVAVGSTRLYDALPGSGIVFRPVSYTHALPVLAALPNFVAINSALDVDLFGQAYAEVGPGGWASGTGGAGDFARGALAAGGLRVVTLPSTAKGSSRIIVPGAGRGPVSLGRADIDIVVTEHGAADLRGRSYDDRAAALITIAAPDHREELARAWRDEPGRF